MAEKWKLEGTVFDACNCETLCPCVYFQAPHEGDCKVTGVFHVNRGKSGNIKLDDFTMAVVGYATQNPLMVIEKAGWVLDEKLTQQQRDALMPILGGKAGGLFSMLSVKNPLGIWWAKFEYANDGKSWSVKAGDALNIKAEFVKPPPGVPVPAAPKKAQTYDPLFGPSMEKIVGTAQTYHASVGGLEFDISGRYSSSGHFSFEGQ